MNVTVTSKRFSPLARGVAVPAAEHPKVLGTVIEPDSEAPLEVVIEVTLGRASVVIAQLREQERIAVNFVNHPVLIGDAPRPETR